MRRSLARADHDRKLKPLRPTVRPGRIVRWLSLIGLIGLAFLVSMMVLMSRLTTAGPTLDRQHYRPAGFAPNVKQVADGGVDDRAMMAEQPEDFDSRLALAQIKGGGFSLGALRDFRHVTERD